ALRAVIPKLPAGAVIVLTNSFFFLVSMVFGPARGIVTRLGQHHRLSSKVGRQHLLRALYEGTEETDREYLTDGELLHSRSWSPLRLKGLILRATWQGDVRRSEGAVGLTEQGEKQAARIVRNHRLWELYLI